MKKGLLIFLKINLEFIVRIKISCGLTLIKGIKK